MRLQAKIHLATIPLALLFMVGLGGWNYLQARSMVEAQIFTHLRATLRTFIKESVDHRHQLLVANGLDSIPSFVERYQQEVQAAATALAKEKGEHFLVFGAENQLVFDTDGGDPVQISQKWAHELQRMGLNPSPQFQGRVADTKGPEEIYYGVYFPPWNWRILFVIPAAEVHATLAQIRSTTLAVALVGGSTLFLVLTILTRMFLLRPIRILRHSAAEIAENPALNTIPITTRDEIGEFARTMETMAERLHQNETHLQNAIDALVESENTYRTLVEQIPQNIFMKDKEGVYLSCNHSFAGSLNRTPDQVRGFRDQDLYPANYAEALRKEDEEVLRSGKILDFETQVRVGGENRWIQKIKAPLKDEIGEMFGLLGVVWDITERKRNEAELERHRNHLEDLVQQRTRELETKNRQLEEESLRRQMAEQQQRASEARFRRHFELGAIGMAMTNLETGWIEVNDQLCQILGYSREELLSMTWVELTHPDDLQPDLEQFQRILSGEIQEYSLEKRFFHKHGQEIHAVISVSCVRLPDGQVDYFVALIQDITARKQAEESLQQTLADLSRSNQELAQFAYVASHDLKEPLRMVSSYVQLLERRYSHQLDQDAREFIQYAVDGATRMQGLINDLLAFSRAGRPEVKLERIEMDQLLDQALANLRGALVETGAEIRRTPLPRLWVEPLPIMQLFQNLVGNAIKFHGPEPPLIQISAQQIKEGWQFSVNDNGIGIDPNHFNRLFILFRRLHGRDRYPGTGIGLALCKKIVERHGGRIWVESRKGEGSTFFFTLRERDPASSRPPTNDQFLPPSE